MDQMEEQKLESSLSIYSLGTSLLKKDEENDLKVTQKMFD